MGGLSVSDCFKYVISGVSPSDTQSMVIHLYYTHYVPENLLFDKVNESFLKRARASSDSAFLMRESIWRVMLESGQIESGRLAHFWTVFVRWLSCCGTYGICITTESDQQQEQPAYGKCSKIGT
ncbi:hypothetical protein GZ77_01605 [Endozoicomonas montiporae]|uniref:Uncharacterized protein n=1 Tax=Endozoicomonas montiporae TaxID=1027273 RepID=A0A081NA99_9GAMM|nr:hypothetical protein GZ77_01605 [Endozoicomonas montiporae]